MDSIPEFEVKVAGGEVLRCTGKVSNLPIHFGDYLLEIDFYVVDLDGLDAILGRQWLRTAGTHLITRPCSWNSQRVISW